MSLISDKKRALIQSMINKEGIAPKANRIPAAPRLNGAIFPASYAQQRLWFFHQLEPSSAAYNMPLAFRLKGPLDVELLKKSVRLTVERHESLRTSFRFAENQLFQVVRENVELDIPVLVLAPCTAAEADAEIKRLAADNAMQSFDLAAGPPIHVRIVEVDETDHVLLACVHHIVFDGVSIGIFTNDLCTIYEALTKSKESDSLRGLRPFTPSGERSLAHTSSGRELQYGDYAHWEQSIDREEDLRYWRETLSGALPVLELPRDRVRPSEPTYYAGYVHAELDEPAVETLRALTRSEGTTLFTVLLAGFHLLLSRYTNLRDIITGTTISARNRSELNEVIGCFVNLLAIRTKIDNPTFREYLHHVQGVLTDAYAHQDTPFDQIVRDLRPDRDLSRSPIVQVVFESGNIGLTAPRLSDVAIYPIWTGVPATVKFELGATVADLGNRVQVTFEYDTDIFDESTMSRMAQHFISLVINASRRPDDKVATLDMMTSAERHRVLCDWNATEREPDYAGCVHDLFEQQAHRTPDQTAVSSDESCLGAQRKGRTLTPSGKESLTYSALDSVATRLAQELIRRGAGEGQIVAVCLPRGVNVMAALLGVLKTGAAYLPLDHTHPLERLRGLAVDAGALLVITDAADAEALRRAGVETMTLPDRPLSEPDGPSLPSVSPDDRIYAIYTSGSTGAPKAAQVLHAGFTNLVAWYLNEFGINARDRFLVISSLAFDLTQKNLFAPLVVGAEIVMYPSASYDPDGIVEIIERRGITMINCTPSAFYPIVKACGGRYERLRTLRYVFLGGEPIATAELREWVESSECSAVVVNTYGPTECTDVSAYYRLTAADYAKPGSPPIGRPVDNVTMYVLDSDLRPVPVGVRGDLYIGGIGVGPGYLRRPELTAEKFIADPFSGNDGARIYRTGDMARYLADGSVVYMGREDDQVKFRGYRIELGEIEAVLRDHLAVSQCAVGVHRNRHGVAELVCYTVTTSPISPPDLAEFLSLRLPKYMVPSFYVSLDAMPMMPNGKLDRKSLPAPLHEDRAQADGYTPPRTLVEGRLCDIWQDVLGLETVGVHDNFFELGGHSLLAAQVIGRTRAAFGVDIPLQTLFDASTIASLAGAIEARLQPHSVGEDGAATAKLPAIPPAPNEAPVPLSYTQERFWLLSRASNADQYYHVNVQIDVDGGLDLDAVHFALDKVVREHSILRMNCVLTENGVQQTYSDHRALQTAFFDLGELKDEERDQHYASRIVPDLNAPFDLTKDALLRCAIIVLARSHTRLLLVFHRVVADGRTLDIFFEDFAAAYAAQLRGEAVSLQKSPVTYADYACWQRSQAANGAWDGDLAYWRDQLRDPPALLPISSDDPASATQIREAGPFPILTYPFAVPDDVFNRLQEIRRELNTSLNTVLLTAFGILLHRLSGCPDMLIGCTTACRSHTELTWMAGPCSNVVMMRLSVDDSVSFVGLLRDVHRTTIEAYEHEDLPFLLLMQTLFGGESPQRPHPNPPLGKGRGNRSPRPPSVPPQAGGSWNISPSPLAGRVGVGFGSPRNLYNVSMVHHHPRDTDRSDSAVEGDWPDFSGWTASAVDPNLLDMRSYMDLHLSTIETVKDLCGYVEYRPDLFLSDGIKAFTESYVAILTAVAKNASTTVDRLAAGPVQHI